MGKRTCDEKIDRVLVHVAQGMDRKSACAREGLNYTTFQKAVRNQPDVKERYETATGHAVEYYRQAILDAANNPRSKEWRALAWLAERLHPKDFAEPKSRVEMTGPDGQALPGPQVAIIADGLPKISKKSLIALAQNPDPAAQLRAGAIDIDPEDDE